MYCPLMAFNGLLNDMIAVLIFDTSHDVRFQLLDKFGLLLMKDMLQGLRLLVLGKHCRSGGHTFWTTLQPYICNESAMMWPFIFSPSFCFAADCRAQRIF